jgi:hypothetical protein
MIRIRNVPSATVHHALFGTVSFLLISATGCGGDAGFQKTDNRGTAPGADLSNVIGAPSLVLADTVLLKETDSVFVGEPSGFVAAPDGTFLIGDRRTSSVHHFAADGSRIKSFGSAGSGPGEFTAIGRLEVDGDSLVYVDNVRRLEIFDYRTGQFKRRKPVPQVVINSIVAQNGYIYINDVKHGRKHTVAAIRADSDSITYGGPYPSYLGRSRVVDEMFAITLLARIGGGDSLAIAVQGTDHIYLGSFREASFDSVRINVARRQGARRDLLDKIDDTNPAEAAQAALYKSSIPWAIGRLSSGHVAYVAADEFLLTNRLGARLFISLVDPQTGSSCVDAQIPVEADPHPWALLHRDTLLILSQNVSAVDKPYAVIRRYALNTRTCQW